jgi:Carboxypeptidase regulatory-like domain
MNRRLVMSALAILAVLTCFPTTTEAQSSINGIVKDSSGAVMPGVTVEAASDALIEKVKSAVTDGNGVYRIVDLRPGEYVVTFTLPGFQSIRREGIVLTAEFTASVNAELRVGELAETITVTGQSPIVDTTTAVHTQVLDRDAIDYLPSGRMIQSIGQLIPGVNLSLPDVGGARAMQQTYMSTHGMAAANNTVMVDGMTINGLQGDGAIQAYVNESMSQEMSYQTSGINAETSAGGVRLNMIPREGGNRFSGDFRYSIRPGEWQGSNLTERHVATGLQAGNAIDRIRDATFSQGGPIRRDKLWFFVSARHNAVDTKIANTFFDDGSQGIDDQYIRQAMLRLTWQVSARNKVSAYFDEIDKYRGHDMQSNEDPEEAALQWFSPAYHTAQVKWASTVSSRMFLEAGWSSNLEYYTNSYRPGIGKDRGTPEWFAGASRLENLQGGRRAAATAENTQSPERQNLQASMSYVTGSHTMKFGVQYQWGDFLHTVNANADLTQQYRSPIGTPKYSVADSVIVRNTPLVYGERLNRDVGIFAQDSWKFRQLTLNYGVRWENVVAQVLAGESPAGRWAPERSFQEIKDVPNWNDWAPRMSAVYDLFGNGRTAIKYSLNRYNQSRTTGIAADYNPLRSLTSASLPWRDINNDDVAQGFRTFNSNGTVTNCVFMTPGCEIDLTNLAPNFGVVALNEYGAYPRTWNLESALELQHEITRGLSGSIAWFRGNFHNLTTTINRSYTHADYTPYTFYDPLTGEPIQVYARTLQNRPTSNLDTFDPERERIYEAFNFEFNARPGRGITLFGGLSVERQLDVACTAPDDPNTLRFCDDRENGVPYRKSFKMSGTVPIIWGINASAVFQSNHGLASSRTMVPTRGTTRYPTNCPAPCPAGEIIMPSTLFGQTTLTVNLVDGDTVYTDRINQLDLRVGKTFEWKRARITPSLEIFNSNNSDAIITYASTNALNAGSSYLRPNSILQPRMIGFNVTTRW